MPVVEDVGQFFQWAKLLWRTIFEGKKIDFSNFCRNIELAEQAVKKDESHFAKYLKKTGVKLGKEQMEPDLVAIIEDMKKDMLITKCYPPPS